MGRWMDGYTPHAYTSPSYTHTTCTGGRTGAMLAEVVVVVYMVVGDDNDDGGSGGGGVRMCVCMCAYLFGGGVVLRWCGGVVVCTSAYVCGDGVVVCV